MDLGVNIDHVATLRQARGTDYPDPTEAVRVWRRTALTSSPFISGRIGVIFRIQMYFGSRGDHHSDEP